MHLSSIFPGLQTAWLYSQEEHRRDCLRVSFAADTLDELALQVCTRNSSLVTPNTFYTLFTNPSYSIQNLRILVSIKPHTQGTLVLLEL